ncbi:MAG: acyl-CoA dehydrogenase C-terminal domain-containing protein [Bermanella sp.]
MPTYQAPLEDYNFIIDDVLDTYTCYKDIPQFSDVNSELIESILSEAGRFAEQEIQPLNQAGDEQGCRVENGEVITPDGYKEVSKKYIEGGWTQLSESTQYGGQGLPYLLNGAIGEMNLSACAAFAIYSTRDGSVAAIEKNGSQEIKDKYLPKLVEGVWGGPMCMSEPHSGSDLGLLRTKAEPQADGSFAITGTKMFITGGDADLGENSIMLVLARIPGAPVGIKGISLFVVPKILVNDDGSLGERNHTSVGSIEHKMGLHGSATCVMNYDGSKGFLIGKENKGMTAMFAMVNRSRFLIGQQGTALAAVSYQNAAQYALDRIQMRALTGPTQPQQAADPIIVHPDVRRMLLTQKAFVEGSRALNLYVAKLFDELDYSNDESRKKQCQSLLDLLTPICKGFNTEMGWECVNHGLQVFGGHGYIRENGMEQFVRDARAAAIYEGTTGIQALDLLARKILASKAETLMIFTNEINQFCKDNKDHQVVGKMAAELKAATAQWLELTMSIGGAAMKNPNDLGAASVDYLMYSGYVTLGYFWVRMAQAAADKENQTPFTQAKLQTAQFYFDRILPRTLTLEKTIQAGSGSLMEMSAESFVL